MSFEDEQKKTRKKMIYIDKAYELHFLFFFFFYIINIFFFFSSFFLSLSYTFFLQGSNMPRAGDRQTLMFSATFPSAMQKLAAEFMQEYIWVGVGRVGSTVSSIEQRYDQILKN